MQAMYSAQKMAEMMGVSVPTIWRWAKAGQLPKPVKLSPGCTRWRESDLNDWMERQGGIHAA